MRLLRGNPRTRATNTVFALTSVSLLVAAVLSDGFRATNVELDDGAVWIVNDVDGWVTKANTQTAEAELALLLTGAEVLQDGDVAYAVTGQGLHLLDGITGTASTATELESGMEVGVAGGTGFLMLPSTGKLWVYPAESLTQWTRESKPTATAGVGSRAAVADSGEVVLVDPTDDTYEVWERDTSGAPRLVASSTFGGDIPDTDSWSLTLVGSTPVVLTGSLLYWGTGRPIDVSSLGTGAVLQENGPRRDSVLVVSESRLARVGKDGVIAELISVDPGTPARPVVVGGCVAAAWSSRTFVYSCPGGTEPYPIPLVEVGEPLSFHQDAGALVLSGSGRHHFVVRDGVLVEITGWDLVDPSNDQQSESEQEPQTVDGEDRQCEEVPAPPVRAPGQMNFGARPAQTVTLDVLSYYSDANCDPLAVASVDYAGPEGSAAVIVNFGQTIQFTAPSEPGSYEVEFQIDDGTPEGVISDTATVTVSDTSKNAPRHLKGGTAKTTVEVDRTVSFNVLVDWVDDDGDSIVLDGAAVTSGGGRVISSPDGLITFDAIGTVPGEVTIDYTVSDGTLGAAGQLMVEVQPSGTKIPPVARDDYAAGRVGQPIKVYPLANDTDANNDLLRAAPMLELLSADDRAALSISTDTPDGSFVITAAEAGTYIIRYSVSDGQDGTAIAAIRLSVIADDGTNRPPVAVRDSAVVRPGRSINVDVLVNDADPDGDLLAVVSASIDPALSSSGDVKVVVIERHYVRVEVRQDPGTPFEVRYGISDGVNPVVFGSLTVSVPRSTVNQFPLLADDRAIVRVGGVVSVNVLANDRDPDGDQLFFIPGANGTAAVWKADATAPGTVWLDGTTVRYKAGPDASGSKPILVYYSVDDDPLLSGLHRSTGRLFIDVRDDETNLPPQPLALELRVFTKATATVVVPLTGIDPNGDAVTLTGLREQDATCGFASIVDDSIVFTARELPGQCQVEYEVEDRSGLDDSLKGYGVIRIVVVDGDPSNPVALDDRVVARPSRDLSVNVLANDSDPNGDKLTVSAAVVASSPDGAAPLSVAPSADGLLVDISVPAVVGEVTYVVRYTVIDPFGGEADATIEVVVRDDALPQAPIARDDYWSQDTTRYREETTKDSSGRSVKVAYFNVVANDFDPDGSRLTLQVRPADGQGVDDGSSLEGLSPVDPGWIRIVMRDDPQWVIYEAVDADGQIGYAVISVPTSLNRAPVCPNEPVKTVVAGQSATTFVVSDLVSDPNGDVVQMTGDISLQPADGSLETAQGNYDSFTYEASPTTRVAEVVVKVGVEDRRGDPSSIATTCFMRITIERLNNPPIVNDSSIEVEETNASATLDLVGDRYVSDPDPVDAGRLQFRLPDDQSSTESLGVTMTITDGGVANFIGEKAAVGVEPVFRYEVWDGQPTSDWQEGKVLVTVVETNAADPTVLSPVLADVSNLEPITVDLADGSSNPFPDTALAFMVTPLPREGRGSVELVGSLLTYTAPTDFFGSAIFEFVASDKVGREVPGTVTFQVIGRPLAPFKPTVTAIDSHSASVSWTLDPAAAQGAEIFEYDVYWRYAGGSPTSTPVTVQGATTTVIGGLDFGRELYFSVVARNKVGDSDPSPESDPIVLDSVPNQPDPPVIDPVVGDGSLTVRWTQPTVDGTPIKGYVLSILPAPPSGQSSISVGNVLVYTWVGLTNGVDYQFSVIAQNSKGSSVASGWSAPLSPARVPDAPTGVTAVDAGSNIECRVRVSWTAAVPNGRVIDGHRIRIMSGSTEIASIETFVNDPATSQTFTVPRCGNYTYQVQAHNAIGWSAWSASSNSLQTATQPSAPTLLSAASDSDRQIPIRVSWTDESASTGCSLIRFEYSTDGRSTFRTLSGGVLPSGSTYTITAQSNGLALVNGTSYSVYIRSVNCKFPSPWSSPGSATPSGDPLASGISIIGSVSGSTITWSWNANGAWNGRPLTSFNVSGASVSSSAGSGSTSAIDYGYSSTQTLTVQACDSLGYCATASLTRTTAPPPIGTVSIVLGPATTSGLCATGDNYIYDARGCYWVRATLSGWPGVHTVRCYVSRTNSTWGLYQTVYLGNGTHDICSQGSGGRKVVVAVDTTIGGVAFTEVIVTGGVGVWAITGFQWPG